MPLVTRLVDRIRLRLSPHSSLLVRLCCGLFGAALYWVSTLSISRSLALHFVRVTPPQAAIQQWQQVGQLTIKASRQHTACVESVFQQCETALDLAFELLSNRTLNATSLNQNGIDSAQDHAVQCSDAQANARKLILAHIQAGATIIINRAAAAAAVAAATNITGSTNSSLASISAVAPAVCTPAEEAGLRADLAYGSSDASDSVALLTADYSVSTSSLISLAAANVAQQVEMRQRYDINYVEAKRKYVSNLLTLDWPQLSVPLYPIARATQDVISSFDSLQVQFRLTALTFVNQLTADLYECIRAHPLANTQTSSSQLTPLASARWSGNNLCSASLLDVFGAPFLAVADRAKSVAVRLQANLNDLVSFSVELMRVLSPILDLLATAQRYLTAATQAFGVNLQTTFGIQSFVPSFDVGQLFSITPVTDIVGSFASIIESWNLYFSRLVTDQLTGGLFRIAQSAQQESAQLLAEVLVASLDQSNSLSKRIDSVSQSLASELAVNYEPPQLELGFDTLLLQFQSELSSFASSQRDAIDQLAQVQSQRLQSALQQEAAINASTSFANASAAAESYFDDQKSASSTYARRLETSISSSQFNLNFDMSAFLVALSSVFVLFLAVDTAWRVYASVRHVVQFAVQPTAFLPHFDVPDKIRSRLTARSSVCASFGSSFRSGSRRTALEILTHPWTIRLIFWSILALIGFLVLSFWIPIYREFRRSCFDDSTPDSTRSESDSQVPEYGYFASEQSENSQASDVDSDLTGNSTAAVSSSTSSWLSRLALTLSSNFAILSGNALSIAEQARYEANRSQKCAQYNQQLIVTSARQAEEFNQASIQQFAADRQLSLYKRCISPASFSPQYNITHSSVGAEAPSASPNANTSLVELDSPFARLLNQTSSLNCSQNQFTSMSRLSPLSNTPGDPAAGVAAAAANCSAAVLPHCSLDDCSSSATTSQQRGMVLLRRSTRSAACESEASVHSHLIAMCLTALIYLCLNAIRSMLISGLTRVFWRRIMAKTGFAYKTTMSQSGRLDRQFQARMQLAFDRHVRSINAQGEMILAYSLGTITIALAALLHMEISGIKL